MYKISYNFLCGLPLEILFLLSYNKGTVRNTTAPRGVERKNSMNNKTLEQIEQAVKVINYATRRVLIADCYEGYELDQLEKALRLLLSETEKK